MERRTAQLYADIAERNMRAVYSALESMEDIENDMPTWKGKKTAQMNELARIKKDRTDARDQLSYIDAEQYLLLRYVLEAACKSSDPKKYVPLVQKLSYKREEKTAEKYLQGEEMPEEAVVSRHSAEDVESYLDTIGFIYKEEQKRPTERKSEEHLNVVNSMNTMSYPLRNHILYGHGADLQYHKLPFYKKSDVDDLRKNIDSYFAKNNYENTKDSKQIREIASRTNQIYCRMVRAEGKSPAGDEVIGKRISLLQNQLKKVSGSVTGNSKEFTAMQNKLNQLADNPTAENFKALQDAAKLYMEQKGSDKRSTSKGQIRYDIANDLYHLGMDVTTEKTTAEDLDRVYQETFRRERSSRVKSDLKALQGENQKSAVKKTSAVVSKKHELVMEKQV